jgi:hypothetical protein
MIHFWIGRVTRPSYAATLVADLNNTVVQYAVRIVFAKSATQRRFIENRMSTVQPPSLGALLLEKRTALKA